MIKILSFLKWLCGISIGTMIICHGFVGFINIAWSATYYLGTTPTTSISYTFESVSTSVWAYTSTTIATQNFANASTTCANLSYRLPNLTEAVMAMLNATNSTTPFLYNTFYWTQSPTDITNNYYIIRSSAWNNNRLRVAVGTLANSDSVTARAICWNTSTLATVTVTNTYYGWNDTLSIGTASSSGEGGDSMSSNDIRIEHILLIILCILTGFSLIRYIFSNKKYD